MWEKVMMEAMQVLAVVQRDLQERQFVVREEDSPETVREIELKNVPIVPRPRPDTSQASSQSYERHTDRLL